MGAYSQKYELYFFLLIIAPSMTSLFWWDDNKDNMETYDVSGWTWLDDESNETWNMCDKYTLAMTSSRHVPMIQWEGYVSTFPEPKTGDSFQRQSLPLIAATEASCGTAVTFEIKNYLNESLYGGAVVEVGELIRTAPDEIRAKYKEVLVVKDNSNSPKAQVAYTVGNTTMDFIASFHMKGKTVEMTLKNKTPGFFAFSSIVIWPWSPKFTTEPKRFHLPSYRSHYSRVSNIHIGEVVVLLTSRLSLPGRFAVTIQVFSSDLTDYYNTLWNLHQILNNKDVMLDLTHL